MSDPQKYINAYVDHAMGMIHEQVSTILQLKTQLRLATEIVPEKDALIASLQEQLDECKNTASGLTKSVEEADTIKASYEAIKNKVSHMDALTSQMNEVKNALLTKNNEYDTLKNELDKLKLEHATMIGQLSEKEAEIVKLTQLIPPPKKVINKKKITEAENVPATEVVNEQPKDENDDF
jgi:chromosome segregation ATPase